MTDNTELEAHLWKTLKSDMTLMLGLIGGEDGHAQPMTAQFDGDAGRGPIYFFTSKETDMAAALGEGGRRATAHFVAKNHKLFACIHGELSPYNDPALIDRLWSPFVAAWFEGGKTDPKLLLLRFDPEEAQIWENENSLLAGVRLLLGRDPKKDYQDKVAEVRLN